MMVRKVHRCSPGSLKTHACSHDNRIHVHALPWAGHSQLLTGGMSVNTLTNPGVQQLIDVVEGENRSEE